MPKVQNKTKARSVPYVKGFKLPSTTKKVEALGYSDIDSVPKTFDFKAFKPVKKCHSIDDWLAQYKEPGQTYSQYISECPWLSSRKIMYMAQTFLEDGKTLAKKYPEGKIYILPLGCMDSFPDIDGLIDYTRKFLQLPVEKLTGTNLDIDNKDKKVHVSFPSEQPNNGKPGKSHLLQTRFKSVDGDTHFQIMVNSCLQTLRLHIPNDALCVVALTMCDLYEDKPDLFVAGMAAGNHRVAVFSLFRYDPSLTFSQEFWYEMERHGTQNQNKRRQQMLQRGCRLLVHEISHILGLGHCVYFDCCMNGSGHLEEDFSQPMHLCPVDLRKLQTLVGFDIVERYKELEDFCKDHGFKKEMLWYKGRIKSITESESKE